MGASWLTRGWGTVDVYGVPQVGGGGGIGVLFEAVPSHLGGAGRTWDACHARVEMCFGGTVRLWGVLRGHVGSTRGPWWKSGSRGLVVRGERCSL